MGRLVNDEGGEGLRICTVKKIVHNGTSFLVIYSIRRIAAVEELRYDYGVKGLLWRKKVSFSQQL